MANKTTERTPPTPVRAPYNFVPFSSRVLAYEGKPPAHNAVDPALKTGEIRLTLTAETPVLVSDGTKHENGGNTARFFRGPDGMPRIPGSAIRGMVRQNMQILGFGLVRLGEDMQDQRVFYRLIAASGDSINKALMDYYHDSVLNVQTVKGSDGKGRLIPQKVEAGYLRREKGGSYYIQPVQGRYLRVPRKVLSGTELEGCCATAQPVRYTAGSDHTATAVYKESGSAAGQPGILLCTGRSVGKDTSAHGYIFPPADESARPVVIPEEDVRDYKADWKGRENSLRGSSYQPEFWKMPEAGEGEKPVFYIQHDGHVFFGMSLFLRIGYQFSLKDGLFKAHMDKQGDEAFLDWPRAILGWAGKEEARRSRVSFGSFFPEGSPREAPPVKVTPGSPKISFYPGYVENGQHYNQKGFRLRGYKQYWLKEPDPTMYTSRDKEKKNMTVTLHPLDAGTVFSGVIRYKNLRPEELGLLLWSIRLEEGCFQSIGMGKPYGLGRVRVSIDALREFDAARMYSPENLCRLPAASPPDAVQAYIDAYDAAAARALGIKQPAEKPSVTSNDGIRDFFYLKRTVRTGKEALREASYMSLDNKEYQKVGEPLRPVAEFRREAEKAAASSVAEDASLDEMKALLANRFNRRRPDPGRDKRQKR